MKVLFVFLVALLLVGFGSRNDIVITPGVGAPGLVELGWDRSTLRRNAGRGRSRVFRNRSCVRFKWHYTEFKTRDIKAYYDRVGDSVEVKPMAVDCISFGPASGGRLENGIRIGHSTRSDVYALYGVVRDNPSADYDSIGLSFGFRNGRYKPYSSADTIDEISVFQPGSVW